MNVLITSGGTREYIDDVRYISNISSGSTAKIISEYLNVKGVKVKLLASIDALKPVDVKVDVFESTDGLNEILKSELASTHYDFVIHMAAISDYTVPKAKGKLSSGDELTLQLKKNIKILPLIKSYSKNLDLKLVGFKLTSDANEEEVSKKITKVFETGADYIVHNDLKNINEFKHFSSIYYQGEKFVENSTKKELAESLYDLIINRSL